MRINSLEEYREFVAKHNIPLDTIRFALGEDKGHEPRWFYIYQDRFTGEWVVAKNKNDGSTAERYRGFDDTSYYQNYVESSYNNDNYYDDDDDDSWDSYDWDDWDSNDSDWDSDW